MYEHSREMDRPPYRAASCATNGAAEAAHQNKKKDRGRSRGAGGFGAGIFGFINVGGAFTGLALILGLEDNMACPICLEHVVEKVEMDASVLKCVHRARRRLRAR